MPQAIPAIAELVAGYIGAGVIGELLIVAALTFVASKLQKTPGSGDFPLNVTVSSPIAERRIILGKTRAAGAMVFIKTSGAKNKYLWYVVVWAGHQVNDLQDCWLDKYRIADADINGTTGVISTAVFDGKLKIWDHLGTQAQAVDSNLDAEFAEWGVNHRLRGCPYSVFRFERSDKAFPTGAPQSCTRLLEGAKVYDPRLDSTNGGSGTHRRDDPSTWAYSANWALAVRWFLSGGSVVNDQSTRLIRYGLQESDSRIDDAYIIAAANISDQSLSGGNAPPSGAQVRYSVGIEFSCGQTRRAILEELLMAGGPGQLVYVHGKWRVYAAAYDSPSHTFTELDLFGEMETNDTTGDEDRYNQLSAVYVDAEQDYTQQTSQVRTNAAYVTQDGSREIPSTIETRAVTDQYRAQRIAEVVLRMSRQMRVVKFKFGRQGLKIAPWETFSMSHTRYGWSGRVFRCVQREPVHADDGSFIVEITARQESTSIYTDPVTADYISGTSVTNALQSDDVDAPTALTAVPMHWAIEFRWTLGEFWENNGISELWEYTSQTPFSSATKIWEGRVSRAVIRKDDSTVRYYWVRVRTIADKVSDTEPATNGLPAAAQPSPQVIFDQYFQLASDQSFWVFKAGLASGSPATNTSISLTGGVIGGYLQFVGDSTDKTAWNNRPSPFQVVTGQQFRLVVRWRRTNTLSSASSSDQVFSADAFTWSGDIPFTAIVTGTSIIKTRAQVNAVNVNEWQEDSVTFSCANNPKSTTQLPFLGAALSMYSTCTSGTMQIDAFVINTI